MEETTIVCYEEIDVDFSNDENSQYIRLSKSSYFSLVFWMTIAGFLIFGAFFIELFNILFFKSEEVLIDIIPIGIAILVLGYFLYIIPYLLFTSYFFRNIYIIQNQEELIFLHVPYNRLLDKKGIHRKVIPRADITRFAIEGSFGDICAVKSDEKISIIPNYYTIDYTKEEGKESEKLIYIGMEEPLAEKICFKLNEFWGFDTTPPITDEQKNELKAD